ncbi:MAG: transcriptional repressor [Treponema sp.]|jgi:Fur family peroxide stress response transcriptional regulator|nr:transcriptional repressor [Treponema sp.]
MNPKGIERKHSKQREAILQMILSSRSHPSARWVYEHVKPAIPGLSLGTVYRNISVLMEEGLVVSRGVVEREERFDGVVTSHPHLICTCCGGIFDLPGDIPLDFSWVSIELPDWKEREPGSGAFLINHQKTHFYGLCSRCYIG